MHYFRTTNDGRIVFGWGGGPFAVRRAPRRPRRASTRRRVERTAAHLREFFPQLEGRAITHAWGGPIDVSPSHLPQVGTLDGAPRPLRVRLHRQRRRPLAPRRPHPRRARDAARRPEVELPAGDPPPVPPEPLAWAGGMVVRAAFLRKERIEAEGRRADLLTRAVCAAPKALGIHVSR